MFSLITLFFINIINKRMKINAFIKYNYDILRIKFRYSISFIIIMLNNLNVIKQRMSRIMFSIIKRNQT